MKQLYDVAVNFEGTLYLYQVKANSETHAQSVAFGILARNTKHTMWGVKNKAKTCSVVKAPKTNSR